MGSDPPHDPLEAVRTSPSRAVPEIVGPAAETGGVAAVAAPAAVTPKTISAVTSAVAMRCGLAMVGPPDPATNRAARPSGTRSQCGSTRASPPWGEGGSGTGV